MGEFLNTVFNGEIIIMVMPALGVGFMKTVLLAASVIPVSFVIGMLIAIGGVSGNTVLKVALVIYIDLFRAFPPLVLIIFIFYGSPFLGVRLEPFLAAFVALTLNASSFYSEVQRTGLESVEWGQTEAARSTGLSVVDTYTWVVLPQALRNVMSPLIGNTIEVVKLTSIASVVSYSELLQVAKEQQSLLFSPTPLIAAALIYLIALWPFVRWLSRFERGFMERD